MFVMSIVQLKPKPTIMTEQDFLKAHKLQEEFADI